RTISRTSSARASPAAVSVVRSSRSQGRVRARASLAVSARSTTSVASIERRSCFRSDCSLVVFVLWIADQLPRKLAGLRLLLRRRKLALATEHLAPDIFAHPGLKTSCTTEHLRAAELQSEQQQRT